MLGRILKLRVIPDARRWYQNEGAQSANLKRSLDMAFDILDAIIEALPPDKGGWGVQR